LICGNGRFLCGTALEWDLIDEGTHQNVSKEITTTEKFTLKPDTSD
jgi:hypothetical protein